MERIETSKVKLGTGILHVYRQLGDLYPAYRLNTDASYGCGDSAEDYTVEGTFYEVLEVFNNDGWTERHWKVINDKNITICDGKY